MMYLMPRDNLDSARAQLTTDYRVTDGYCVELYHVIKGTAVLTVKTRGEDNIERTIATTIIQTQVGCFIWTRERNSCLKLRAS